MEKAFKEAFDGLNARQRQAVETLDGPVLVVAGPGTGKTQLISTRVGHIIQNTDTLPESILLLTFTEAGVQAMRQRLDKLIGRAAYEVQLSTYHAFGGEIFRRYPDYLQGQNLNLLEALGVDTVLRSVIAELPYSDPLKFADSYINDLKSFISDCKRALLKPQVIKTVAESNLKFLEKANKNLNDELQALAIVSKKSIPLFETIEKYLNKVEITSITEGILPLADYARVELRSSLDYFKTSGKTTALSEWKRHWLARDDRGRLIFDGRRQNEKLKSAARVYHRYQVRLKNRQLYDYDDMILRAIETLKQNPELKYSLAERYSYIMLDEFQDTNPAQFELVKLLTDHPVHEGRPNILAVGDDDQAIYAFQGADHANMADFVRHYKNVSLVVLDENYRSTQEILHTAQNISSQITNRLTGEIFGITKNLNAINKTYGKRAIEAREFKSDAAQYDWVAGEIKRLIKQGCPPSEIAVLAPKHRYLTALLPYLAEDKIEVYYERRENILDEPLIRQLEQMSRLVITLAEGDEQSADSLWPEVLSYDFWKIPTQKIWQISWQARQSREPWTAILLNDESLNHITVFFLRLASLENTVSMEQQLDALVGWPNSQQELNLPMLSPLYGQYFSKSASESNADNFYNLISKLNVLRSNLRDWLQTKDERTLNLRNFVEFIEGHRAANINILNTNPYYEIWDSVGLMTAYGAKGKEFQNVFILSAVDEVWGSASRNQGYRLSLPANLSYIRYQGASEDERLRLLYVAVTRAKTRLYLTAYKKTLAGKVVSRLKYLGVTEQTDNKPEAAIFPSNYRQLKLDATETMSLSAVSNYWTDRHTPPFGASLQKFMKPRLQNYRLSPTDINYFLNIADYGPDEFFMKCLLNFPSAHQAASAFGTALHITFRFGGNMYLKDKKLPALNRLTDIFEAQLERYILPKTETVNLKSRGQASIKAWLAHSAMRLKPADRLEYNFDNENVRAGLVRLTGIVDRLELDAKNRRITIVDYKTGRSYSRWQAGIAKLHLYSLQLRIYKLLIENSYRFKGYEVDKGIIEFVEPDEEGRINRLELHFSKQDLQSASKLLESIWKHIQTLSFPDVSSYPKNLAGIKKFESDLIKQKTGR